MTRGAAVSEPVLAEAAVIAALSADDGPDWHLIAGKLVKTVACADFVAALAYVGGWVAWPRPPITTPTSTSATTG